MLFQKSSLKLSSDRRHADCLSFTSCLDIASYYIICNAIYLISTMYLLWQIRLKYHHIDQSFTTMLPNYKFVKLFELQVWPGDWLILQKHHCLTRIILCAQDKNINCILIKKTFSILIIIIIIDNFCIALFSGVPKLTALKDVVQQTIPTYIQWAWVGYREIVNRRCRCVCVVVYKFIVSERERDGSERDTAKYNWTRVV